MYSYSKNSARQERNKYILQVLKTYVYSIKVHVYIFCNTLISKYLKPKT